MNRETSVYLDGVRFTAALIVMVSHLGRHSWSGGLGWQFVPFGAGAVDIFFVLSGYVIAYAAAEKERDLKSYAVNRIARIYSVVLPALLVTAVLCSLGSVLRPSFQWGDGSAVAYLRTATFTNEIWFSSLTPGNDGPFWSLGFEIWYYIFFGAFLFASHRYRYSLAALALVVAGPRIVLMLPLWLMGIAAYSFVRHKSLSEPRALTLWGCSLAGLVVLAILQFQRFKTCQHNCGLDAAYARPLRDWQDYATDYAVGFLIAVNFIGFYFSSRWWRIPIAAVGRPVQWMAGATFTLYLLHYPLARFLIAMSPWKTGTAPQQILVYAGTLFAVAAAAQITERRKRQWRAGVERLMRFAGTPFAMR